MNLSGSDALLRSILLPHNALFPISNFHSDPGPNSVSVEYRCTPSRVSLSSAAIRSTHRFRADFSLVGKF
ncbi:unnamed protein product [Citrullus colocynthis]|uniref:Uncharacterized protein n=1 Tax=Citrullus colocynthis TaxID=252529 RepID=A0ABP0Y811_9ROSI